MGTSSTIRKLFRIAFMTSPLIGLFSVIPFILLGPLHPERIPNSAYIYWKYIIVLVTTAIVFLLWLINIGLYKYVAEGKAGIKFKRYILSYVCCFVLVGIIIIARLSQHSKEPVNPSFIFLPLAGLVSNNTVLLIIMDLVILRDRKSEMEGEITNLKLTTALAQKEQLKSQIHPHFLFNSLSMLKTLMRKSPDDAEQYLLNLSNFLRSSLNNSEEDKVILESEVVLCTEYLEMQKMRFRDSLYYFINIPDEAGKRFYLPIFSLQMLTENAIKHNSFTKQSPLNIEINLINGSVIEVKNNTTKKSTEPSTGLGLKNLNERIKLLTNQQKEIKVNGSQGYFSVTVPLISV